MRAEVQNAVELLQTGGENAVPRAVELLQNTVFSFSMKVCGHREDAEDTMQDVLTKAIRYLPQFENGQALAVWLYKVAKNRCLMSRRRSKFAPKETISLDELMPDEAELEHFARHGAGPESELLRNESAEHVRAAIHRIPPQYRLILVLHDMEELSTEEVARVTGLREGTVRVRLHRARLMLRKELTSKAHRSSQAHRKMSSKARHHRPGSCKQMFATISDYLDGALDPSLCDEFEKHMSGCKPCEAFVESLRSTIERLKDTDAPRLDPATSARIRAQILDRLQQALATAR